MEKDQFYEQLEIATRQAETVIIGGDLNGHVGRDGRESTSHGNIGLGERNEEGNRVVEFANTFDLVIANTWFTKTRNQLITFKSGNSESQIDYILTNRRHLKDILNCKTIPGEAVVSQHRLVVMDLRTRTKKKRQYRRENEVKIKWWRLKDQAVADDYAKDVINNMGDCEQPEWTLFSEKVKEKGSEHCGVTTGGKSMQKRETWWWNTTVQEAIAKKKRMFKKWQQSKAQEDHAVYKATKREAKRTVAVERARAAQELYEKLDTREGEKAIYRLAKSRDQATKDNYQGYFVKAQDGTLLIMNTEENISRWAEYYRDLLNKARQHIEGRDEPRTEGPLHEVTCEEVERQLNKMKNGKSSGPDGIPTEALKHLGDWGVHQLTKIFNAIMQSGKMPDEWRESTITPIYKDKGDHMNCSNYRGIKLLSHTMKLWERIIDQRLRDIECLSDGQFGFKPGVGTTDAIFIIRILCEKYREGNKPIDMVFVDVEKAYDTVPCEVLWRCMRKQNIPEVYIRLVQDMYQGATTRVKSKRGISEHFEVGIGLHQGSALSPFLFIMLLDTISQDVQTELPRELLYADDLAIIDITNEDTQNRLESWQKVLTDNGLKVNVAKTEHLSARENPLPVKLNGEELKNVDHFKYLGSVIDKDGTIDRDVDLRG